MTQRWTNVMSGVIICPWDILLLEAPLDYMQKMSPEGTNTPPNNPMLFFLDNINL